MLLIGKWLNCGPKASCYEAVLSYNSKISSEIVSVYYNYLIIKDGALKLVQRRCFTPPNNNTSLNFCNTPYSNPVGRILECHSCNTTKCNSHLIKSENYGHDGHFLMNETGDWSKIVSPLYDSFSINDYLEVGN